MVSESFHNLHCHVPKRTAMKNTLEVRRRRLLRDIERVNRKIAWTQKNMAVLENRIASLSRVATRAA
jgi:hypothetical protein